MNVSKLDRFYKSLMWRYPDNEHSDQRAYCDWNVVFIMIHYEMCYRPVPVYKTS